MHACVYTTEEIKLIIQKKQKNIRSIQTWNNKKRKTKDSLF